MIDPVEGSLIWADYVRIYASTGGRFLVDYREMRATIRTPHRTAAITLHELQQARCQSQRESGPRPSRA
jgi:hypothetical protein